MIDQGEGVKVGSGVSVTGAVLDGVGVIVGVGGSPTTVNVPET